MANIRSRLNHLEKGHKDDDITVVIHDFCNVDIRPGDTKFDVLTRYYGGDQERAKRHIKREQDPNVIVKDFSRLGRLPS